MSADSADWKLMTTARSGVVSVARFGSKAEANRAADVALGIDRSAPPLEVIGFDHESMAILVRGSDGQTCRLLPRQKEPWDIVKAEVFQ